MYFYRVRALHSLKCKTRARPFAICERVWLSLSSQERGLGVRFGGSTSTAPARISSHRGCWLVWAARDRQGTGARLRLAATLRVVRIYQVFVNRGDLLGNRRALPGARIH